VIPVSRLRTLAEWAFILIPFIVMGFAGYYFIFGAGAPAHERSGLPDTTGGFSQSPFSPPQEFKKTLGDWQYTFTSSYTYTLSGRMVGRHEYPAALPDGIIPLDIAVVNGDLARKEILSFFTFDMGDHTLRYSYDIPNGLGLTEEYIDEHISNNHLVFLNSTLEHEVRLALEGSCMVIRGKLIDIHGSSYGKQYSARTSTVRNDTYPAGCEIILVESYTPVNCGDETGPS
jgi:hypothetical protein